MPADLVPKAALQCQVAEWQRLIWQMQRLCGPGALARRPDIWGLATLLAIYKRGVATLIESYRLSFVKVQMALMQESMLSRRLTPQVHGHLVPGQSGHCRGHCRKCHPSSTLLDTPQTVSKLDLEAPGPPWQVPSPPLAA